MRIGLKPNKSEKSMFCFFMTPDGALVGNKDTAPYKDESLSVKGLAFEKIMPERLWKMSFSGIMARMSQTGMAPEAVTFELSFEALNEIFDYRECVSGFKEEISKSVASEHLEQYGRVEGSMRIGGREFMVSGLGERDHSWGVRDWNAPKMWIWLTSEFSDSLALNVTKLVVDQGEVDAGFIHVGGKSIAIMEAVIDTEYGSDGGPKKLSLVLKDKESKEYRVSAEILKTAKLPFEGPDGRLSVMYETLARYTFQGQEGYGIAEYLIKKS